jgi:hypothetical protein
VETGFPGAGSGFESDGRLHLGYLDGNDLLGLRVPLLGPSLGVELCQGLLDLLVFGFD